MQSGVKKELRRHFFNGYQHAMCIYFWLGWSINKYFVMSFISSSISKANKSRNLYFHSRMKLSENQRESVLAVFVMEIKLISTSVENHHFRTTAYVQTIKTANKAEAERLDDANLHFTMFDIFRLHWNWTRFVWNKAGAWIVINFAAKSKH